MKTNYNENVAQRDFALTDWCHLRKQGAVNSTSATSADWFQPPLCFHSLRQQCLLPACMLNCVTDNGAILRWQ